MEIIFRNQGESILPKDVDALERKCALNFPKEYKDFLVNIRGGTPLNRLFPAPSHPEKAFAVQILFSVKKSIETSTIAWRYELTSKSPIGPGYLPIGCDEGGSLILLDLDPSHRYGSVWFLDIVYAWGDRWEKDKALHFVAPSFTAFLDSLYDAPLI